MSEQQRLIAILEYLKDWDKLTRSPVSRVTEYRAGFSASQKQVIACPDIKLNVSQGDEDDLWMIIPRLSKQQPPQVGDSLKDWIIVKSDPNTQPLNKESLELALDEPAGETKQLYFEDDPELKSEFANYLRDSWGPWAKREKERRKCIAIYESLFQLKQKIETSGAETPIELVWGMGIAAWNKSDHTIQHPLITQQVEIISRDEDMALSLRPTSRDPQLETDPFLPLELQQLPNYERSVHETLDKAGVSPSPFEPTSFECVTKSAAASLDTTGRYWPEEENYIAGELPEPQENLIVSDSWIVFARVRNTNFLVEDLKRLTEAIEQDGVPAGAPHFLVEEPSGIMPEPPQIAFRGLSSAGDWGVVGSHRSTGESAKANSCKELFFPKAFNQEQVEIIKRLESSPGVVVQGPPGTGKTHTIANIICHYLASGKRVLVTSKGETALSVLQEQIPESVRELTVSLLTNERDGKAQLERTVNRISAKLTTLSSSELQVEIKDTEGQIDRLHQKIARIDSDLREWARKNTEPPPQHIANSSPETLAREVVASEEEHSWFPDELDESSDHDPKFSDEEMLDLSAARLLLGSNLEYVDVTLPSIGDLPSEAQMIAVHESLCEQGKLVAEIQEKGLARLAANDQAALCAAENLHAEIKAHLKLLAQCGERWQEQLRTIYRESLDQESPSGILSNLDGLLKQSLQLSDGLSEYAATVIDLPQGCETDDLLVTAIERAVAGQRPFPWLAFGVSQTKERFNSIQINGTQPNHVDQWQLVLEYFRLISQSRTLLIKWNKFCQQIDAPAVDGEPEQAIPRLRAIVSSIEAAKELGRMYDATLCERVIGVFPQIPDSQIEASESFLIHIDRSIEAQLRQCKLAASKNVVDHLETLTKSCSGELFKRIDDWRTGQLGNAAFDANTIGHTWGAFMGEVENLHGSSEAFSIVRRVTDSIAQSGAVEWARNLREEPTLSEPDAVIPTNWKASWLWSRQRGYLHAIDGRATILKLAVDRRNTELELRRKYESAIEKRTWLRLVEQLRMDRAIGRAIIAYVQALTGMTKSGKGKRDGKLRHAAREAMNHASRGVPCWIMPHWRVSESLPPRLGDFDLVVVDEASQSDAWAVPSIIRGKKILIVGDDKQVGPQPSFTSQEQIDQIQERLKSANVPSDIRNRLDPKESIYNLGELVFSGQTIRLREHFRCALPIIQFSNKLCYDGEIKCVRIPKANERLLPTLIDVHLKTGYRDSSRKINKPEAQAIVDEIATLIVDLSFGERSIGVVSLLGNEQAKVIYDLLWEKIGQEAFLKHRIRCGDARTFQGSERDVMFISCVDDAASGTVLTSNRLDNIRRINVAVSRAKDRLYLFHSFSRQDLSENDLRARLMDHFQAPIEGLYDKQGIDLCESGFEREMFQSLVEKGYRVIPQVPCGTYRIDMVVEGHDGKRLAVECDGDRYHGPDKWMEDVGRQRVLERAGWKFWRCWGSSFALDKVACIQDLEETLKSDGIKPMNESEVNFSGLVDFRVVVEEDDQRSKSEQDCESEKPNFVARNQKTSGSVVSEQLQLKETSPDSTSGQSDQGSLFASPKRGAGQAGRLEQLPLKSIAGNPKPDNKPLVPTISVGDSVHYRRTENNTNEDNYITISDLPSKPKLGIVNAEAPIAQHLLGRREGEKFEARILDRSVTIAILKHEIND
jgi:very-short-patch-repair endonuclease